MDKESPQKKSSLHDFSHTGKGKRSVIAEYCREAINNGHTECILICVRRKARYIIQDIPLTPDGPVVGLHDLRRRHSWWKRLSLHSATGVREVIASFVDINNRNEISAVIADFDYADIISRLDARITSGDHVSDPMSCGVDAHGRCHDERIGCQLMLWGSFGSNAYFRVNYLHGLSVERLSLERDSYKWLPSMLEFYWQSGIGEKGQRFLRNTSFIHSYRQLEYDRWLEAASPYGKTVRAFLVVEGWHIRYLLTLIGLGIALAICVVAVTTAISHDVETGLTAGSYVGGLVTALIAIFTFLSAVI